MSTRVVVLIVVALVFFGIGMYAGNTMAKKKSAKALEASTTAPATTDEKTV